MKFKKLSLILVMMLLTLIMSSCGKKIDAVDVRSYSDSALENILQSANKDDYAGYSRDFSDKMKAALTESIFKQQNQMIKDRIGEYSSKEFVKTTSTRENGINYITAIYNVKYTNEPKGAMVSITFRNGDKDHKVEGLFMTSPKLASK